MHFTHVGYINDKADMSFGNNTINDGSSISCVVKRYFSFIIVVVIIAAGVTNYLRTKKKKKN